MILSLAFFLPCLGIGWRPAGHWPARPGPHCAAEWTALARGRAVELPLSLSPGSCWRVCLACLLACYGSGSSELDPRRGALHPQTLQSWLGHWTGFQPHGRVCLSLSLSCLLACSRSLSLSLLLACLLARRLGQGVPPNPAHGATPAVLVRSVGENWTLQLSWYGGPGPNSCY